MSATSWEVAGLVVHAPVTAATNVLLAAECLWLVGRRPPCAGRCTGPGARPWARHWRGFLLWTAVAAATGALKHALGDGSPGVAMPLARFVSNAATGTAAFHGARAAVTARCPGTRSATLFGSATAALLALFLGVTLADPRFLWVVAASAAFLGPVLLVEALAWRRGSDAAGWILLGLAISTLTGAVYLARVSAGPWLDQNDIAHLLAMAAVLAIDRGGRLDPTAGPRLGVRVGRDRTLGGEEAACPSL